MLCVGIIGYRGMVGSVLMERMREEKDFVGIAPTFFSTSNAGADAPDVGLGPSKLVDAHSLEALEKQDVLISCQGGDYTTAVYSRLRARGFAGYWIDAASTLRMLDETVLILDPVNLSVIEEGLTRGIKTYAGPNCTVSLMLMALGGLFKAGHVEWLTSMTYQAASGAGANNMRELVAQMAAIGRVTAPLLADPSSTALEIDRSVTNAQRDGSLPTAYFQHPLAGSLLPFIDKPVEHGQSKEEWKGLVETNKILGLSPPVPVDGQCVRIGAMRCHSQGFTIKLKRAVPMDEITELVRTANPWVRLVENMREASLSSLTPTAISGKLEVAIGRLRKMRLGPEYLTAFSVGDQLLWGAAEPLRRMLNIVRARVEK
ncbi:MAG TPA: aspartate-semialdehyde dehydrogenase [Polyangiaceae bacterium]